MPLIDSHTDFTTWLQARADNRQSAPVPPLTSSSESVFKGISVSRLRDSLRSFFSFMTRSFPSLKTWEDRTDPPPRLSDGADAMPRSLARSAAHFDEQCA